MADITHLQKTPCGKKQKKTERIFFLLCERKCERKEKQAQKKSKKKEDEYFRDFLCSQQLLGPQMGFSCNPIRTRSCCNHLGCYDLAKGTLPKGCSCW